MESSSPRRCTPTQPTRFHSETDDAFPIASQLGSLSLVAADFCQHGLLDLTSAAYRLGPNGWAELGPALQHVIEVIE